MRKITIFIILFVFLYLSPLYAEEKTIGVLMTADIPYYNNIHQALVNELNNQGLDEGTVNIIVQQPEPVRMAWINAARKFVVLEVDIIVTYGASSTLIVMKETSKIPIVYSGVYDPSALGILAKNITGISCKVPVTGLIKNFKKISSFSKLCIIYSSTEKDTIMQIEDIQKLEAQVGFTSVKYDFNPTVDTITIPACDAIFLTTSSAAMKSIDNISRIAAEKKIPIVSIMSSLEKDDILLTFCADPKDQGKEAAKIVKEIINNQKPSAIASKEAGKKEMIINMKMAKTLDLNIPTNLLKAASKIIK